MASAGHQEPRYWIATVLVKPLRWPLSGDLVRAGEAVTFCAESGVCWASTTRRAGHRELFAVGFSPELRTITFHLLLSP